MTSKFERNHTAKAIKNIRKILQQGKSEPISCDCSACEVSLVDNSPVDSDKVFSAGMLGMSLLIAGLMLVGSCIHSTPAHAEIPESKAVKILVGEASNQGFKGMVCVGEVLRRQGSTRGFCGLNASHSAHEPKWVWNMARRAWLASKTSNLTKYADHFENLKLDTPYWVKNCVLTFRYKDHAFFREVKRA